MTTNRAANKCIDAIHQCIRGEIDGDQLCAISADVGREVEPEYWGAESLLGGYDG